MTNTARQRSVAGRLLQNLNGVIFEVEQMKRILRDESSSFSTGDQLVLERSIEKLQTEAERLSRLLHDPDRIEPLRVAR